MYMQAQLIHRGYISYAYILDQDKKYFYLIKDIVYSVKFGVDEKVF